MPRRTTIIAERILDADGEEFAVTTESSVFQPYDAPPAVVVTRYPNRHRQVMVFDAESADGARALDELIDGLTEARRRVRVAVEERYAALAVGDDTTDLAAPDTVDEQCNLLITGTGRVCNRARHADIHHVAFDPDTTEVLAVMHGRPE